jgi:predicted phage tail protein
MKDHLKRIYLHGKLKEKFGQFFDFDIATPREALRALISQLKGFRAAMNEGHYRIVRGALEGGMDLDVDQIDLAFGRCREFHIIPVVAGADKAGGLGKIVLGVVLVAAAVALSGPGGLGAAAFSIGSYAVTYGSIAGVGVALTLAGVASLLTPTFKTPDIGQTEDQKPSYLFNGPVNVANQGNPIPLVYGRIRCGSVVVSTGITTEIITDGGNPPAG